MVVYHRQITILSSVRERETTTSSMIFFLGLNCERKQNLDWAVPTTSSTSTRWVVSALCERIKSCIHGQMWMMQGGSSVIQGKDDASDFKRFRTAMEVLGFAVNYHPHTHTDCLA